MIRQIILGAVLIVLQSSVASAQERQYKPDELEVNPEIAKLLKADQHSIVELEGYVGRSDRDTVRLHLSLDLSEYVELPSGSILSFSKITDDRGDRVRISVGSRTEVKVVSTFVAGDVSGGDIPGSLASYNICKLVGVLCFRAGNRFLVVGGLDHFCDFLRENYLNALSRWAKRTAILDLYRSGCISRDEAEGLFDEIG